MNFLLWSAPALLFAEPLDLSCFDTVVWQAHHWASELCIPEKVARSMHRRLDAQLRFSSQPT